MPCFMHQACTGDLTFKRKLFIYLFIYLFIIGCARSFVAVCGLSLVVVSGGCSSLRCLRFSLQWLLLLQSIGSRVRGLSSCGSRALEHKLSSFGAWGLVAPRHMESFWTRDGTCVPCLGRQILIHRANRVVHELTS